MAEKKEITTALSEWQKAYTGLVTRDFAECGVDFTDASKNCCMNAMVSIWNLIKDSGKKPEQFDTSSIKQALGQASSLQLNAAAYPSECYFQTRNKKSGDNWVTVVEMGIQGAGNDAILRNFGVGVAEVYPVWIVHEGDDFEYPSFNGIEITPPKWSPKTWTGKVVRVVYPVKMVDGRINYLISERESAKVNLFAHVRNNLLNQTFGICADRYKATEAQKAKIAEKKEEIYDALRQCETLDDMLNCKLARPYISAAWLESTESMIERKLRNNAIKPVPKDYNSMAKRSFLELDETYKAAKEEREELANSEELVVEGTAVEEAEEVTE